MFIKEKKNFFIKGEREEADVQGMFLSFASSHPSASALSLFFHLLSPASAGTFGRVWRHFWFVSPGRGGVVLLHLMQRGPGGSYRAQGSTLPPTALQSEMPVVPKLRSSAQEPLLAYGALLLSLVPLSRTCL